MRPASLEARLDDGSVRAGDGSERTALLTNLAGNFLLGGFITLACDGSVFPAEPTLFLQIGGYASPIPAPAAGALPAFGLLGMAAVRPWRPPAP